MAMVESGFVQTNPMGYTGAVLAAMQAASADLQNAQLRAKTDRDVARMQADASMFGEKQKQGRFNQVFPFLTSALGRFGLSGPPGPGNPIFGNGLPSPLDQPGSASPASQGPRIAAGPVWDAGQVQRQVNASRANVDAQTASRQRQAQQSTGARGFGSRSPLLAALQQQIAGQGMATGADQARDIRWQAAQGNAQQMLEGTKAQEGQYATRQAEGLEKRRQDVSGIQALLQALGGLV